MILNFMERYFYLICFASYALKAGPAGFPTTFKAWMDERPHLRKVGFQFYEGEEPTTPRKDLRIGS